MPDQQRFGGDASVSGHGRFSNTTSVALQGSVLHAGSLRSVADVRAGAPLSNLPSPAPAPFVGRDNELHALAEALNLPGRLVVVTGFAGVGKSALASSYARDQRDTAVAWWVTAGSPTKIDTGLAHLTYALQPELAGSLTMEEAARRAVRWLAEHDGWLLVLDDVTDPADVGSLLRDLAGSRGRVLLTTRLSYGWHLPGTTALRLEPLAEDAAAALLTRLLEQESGPLKPEAHPEVRQLALQVGCLPLALTVAAASLRKTGMTVAQLRRRLAEHSLAPDGADGRTGSLADVIRFALATVADQPGALPLLRALSWFSDQPVPVEVLSGAAEEIGADVASALQTLAERHLVRLDDDTVSVHRHVQTVVRTVDDRDPLRGAEPIRLGLATATALLDDRLPPVHHAGSWPRWQLLLPHISALADRSAPDADTTTTAHLLNRTGLFLCEQGNPVEALTLLERSYAAYRRIGGEDHPAAIAAITNVAGALQVSGRIDQAAACFRRALDVCERVLGPDHPATLDCRAELAGALLARGETGQAVGLLEHALDEHVRILGEDHPTTLTVTANLAYAYQVADRPERAVPLLARTLAGRREALGPDHPVTLMTRHNLAGALHAAGDLTRAVPLLEENLSARLRVLGGDHPDTLTSLNSLAYALLSAGDVERAVPLLERALADRERVLGANALDTITSRSNLAAAYQTAGNLARALDLFHQTLAHCLERLGPDHPDTLAARQNLAGAYRAAGRNAEALELFELNRAETQRLRGPLHPDTLTARNNLAAAYWENGDLPQALPLLEQQVVDCGRVLGDRHPNTLAARANLALALLNAGEPDRALPLLERTVTDDEQVLGPDHPATLTAANNLAGAYGESGRLAEATALYESNCERRTRVLGPHHPDVLASRNNLAGAYQAAGRVEQAIAQYEDLLRQSEDALGRDHRLTRTVRRNLSALTRTAGGD